MKKIYLLLLLAFCFGANRVMAQACSGAPTPGTISASATSGCGTYTSVLSLSGATTGTGLTYTWYSSTDGTTFNQAPGAATNATYTATVTGTSYYECTIFCSTNYATTPAYTLTAGTTGPIPYAEGFEGLSTANTLPTCMAATNLGTNELTYIAAQNPALGRSAHAGSRFATFTSAATNDYFWTPAFNLTAGVSYQFSFWYITDGQPGWNLGVQYGNAQTAVAMTNTANGASLTGITNTTYAQWTGTITPTTSGPTFIGIHCTSANGTNFYMSIDDMALISLIPNISSSAAVPLNLGNVAVGNTSAAQIFSVSGAYLANYPGNITLTAPADYQVSSSGTAGTYGTTASITYTASTLANTPVWIEFTPPTVGIFADTVRATIPPASGITTTLKIPVTGTGITNCTAPVDQPTGISFTGTVSNSTSATFSDASGATGYIVVASNGPFTGTVTNGTTYALNAAIGTGTVVATVTTPTVSVGVAYSPTLTLTGLTPNSAVTITVFPYTNSTSCVGPIYNIVSPLSGMISTCLAPPTVSVVSYNSGTIGLSWTASSGATNYQVQMSSSGGPVPGSPFTIAAPATTLTVADLTSGTTYSYTVIATGGNCNSTNVTGSTTPGVYTMVYPLGGLNQDLIANGNGSVTATTTSGFGGAFYFIAQDYNNVVNGVTYLPAAGDYLPNGGLISSVVAATTGLKFQIPNYSGNNALYITAGTAGTITFPTPLYASTVYPLATTANGSTTSTLNFKVNFADGTSQTFLSALVPDWGSGAGGYAITNIGRIGVGAINGSTGFSLFQPAMAISAANQTKKITSIVADESGTGTTAAAVFAVSIRDADLTTSVGSLTFSGTPNCSAGAAQVFSVSGTNLFPVPTGGAITVNAPAGFLVSNALAGTYTTTATLSFSAATTSNIPVYVEFSPLIGGTTTGNITFTGGGLNFPPSVTVSGTSTGLAISPTTTAAFGNQSLSVSSASQIYTLTGTGLTPGTINLTMSGSGDFQISQNGTSGWTNTYSITTTATLSATPIYIRFTPTGLGAESATVTVTGGGALCPSTINLTGTGVNGCVAPGLPTAMTFTGTNSSGTTVGFTPTGAPDGYLVIQSTAPFAGTPVTGTTYATGASIGNGTVVGSYNNALPIAITSQTLAPITGNTAYHITVIPFTGGSFGNCGGGPLYATGNLSGAYTTCPASPSPVTTSSITTTSLSLNWNSSTGGGASAVTYSIQVATDAGFVNQITGSPFSTPGLTLALSSLSPGITYYYSIIANGACTSPSVTSNAITTSLTYACAPTYVDGCGSWYASNISGLGMNFNGAGCNAPSQLTQIATVIAGYADGPLSVTTQGYTGCSFWADLNNSGSFENSENLWHQYNGNSPYTYSPYLLVAPTTAAGFYRLRYVAGWGSDGYGPGGSSTNLTGTNGYGPCGEYAYETYEDFTLQVVASSYVASTDSLTLDSTELCHTSATGIYTLSAGPIAISPVPSTLTVTAPAGFLVSPDGSTWSGTYSITATSATLPATPVYVQFAPTALGAASGYVNITGANGGSSVFVQSAGTPAPVVSPVTATTMTYCYNGTPILDTLTDTLAGGAWSSGNSAIASVNSSTGIVTILGAGTVNITYSVTTCITDTANVILTVNATPSATITPAGPSVSICQGDSITLQTTQGTGISYQWFMNTDTLAGATNGTYTANAAGSYAVMTASSANCIDSTTIPVAIVVNPLPVPVITQTGGDVLGTTVSYSTYQWYLNGVAINTATNATYTALIQGIYTVKVTDANGCSATSVSYIETLGVSNVSNDKPISIYPNPNNGSFILSGFITSSDDKAKMEITDVTGKVITRTDLILKNGAVYQQVNINNGLPAEVYFIKISSDKQTVVLPFVKQ